MRCCECDAHAERPRPRSCPLAFRRWTTGNTLNLELVSSAVPPSVCASGISPPRLIGVPRFRPAVSPSRPARSGCGAETTERALDRLVRSDSRRLKADRPVRTDIERHAQRILSGAARAAFGRARRREVDRRGTHGPDRGPTLPAADPFRAGARCLLDVAATRATGVRRVAGPTRATRRPIHAASTLERGLIVSPCSCHDTGCPVDSTTDIQRSPVTSTRLRKRVASGMGT
jgi:hypothetical protein